MSIISGDTIKGSFHQGDSSHFSDETLGRQCMANSVAAAVYATMLPINYWNPPVLDRILIAGDELYRRRCNQQYQYLQFSDIRNTKLLFGQQHDMNSNDPITGLLQYESAPSPPFFTLDQVVSSMENLQQWTYGILTLADGNDGTSVLLCVKQGNYYIFDSHSRDVFGNVVPNGTSVLLHMKTHNACMKYIKTIGYQLGATQFEITVLSPAVSGFHRMLEGRSSSQKSENNGKIENNKSQTRRSTRNSTKKQTENLQNLQNDQSKEKTSKSKRSSNSNCTKEQNKQKVQNLNTSQNEKETSRERAKNYNEKRQKKKEEEKNRRSERHEKRKIQKTIDGDKDEEFNTSQKRRKTQKLENNNSSMNIEKRYNTRSKTRRENTNCEPIQLNSSQSNKRKQITDDKIIKRKRTTKNKTTNTNESSHEHNENENIDDSNNINTEEEIGNGHGHIENNSINMDECLKLFNIKTSNGPIYVCTVCLQTWFRRSVFNIEFIKVSSEVEEHKLNQCRKNYVSAEDKEWICKGCRDSIKTGKIPKFSIENKMGFPPQPQELKLNGMEERFTAPRLTLFQMRDLPCGGQKSVRGNSVNLPIDIAPTVEMLPRTLDNTETIAINYKRRLCYKGCAFKQENI